MPSLKKSLEGRDLGGLQIIAELWGLELRVSDLRQANEYLTAVLLDLDLIDEIIAAMPRHALSALVELYREGTKLPWSVFTRQFGGVREMGSGRRDRERPYINSNASSAEALWYRGLVGRAFFSTEEGPIEYAYIPDEFVSVLPIEKNIVSTPLGRPASKAERRFIRLANDHILDDACTLLAALRSGIGDDIIADMFLCGRLGAFKLDKDSLLNFLASCELLDPDNNPLPEPTRKFLEMSRSEALVYMVGCWRKSEYFNELFLIPDIAPEGEWKNNPQRTREVILESLNSMIVQEMETEQHKGITESSRSFWSLESFVKAIHKSNPDYQRPTGDYDSWYLRDLESGKFLRGYEHWDDIDGQLLRFFVTGILHWLGIVDIAFATNPEIRLSDDSPNIDKQVIATAFRLSNKAAELLKWTGSVEVERGEIDKQEEKMFIRDDGSVRVPINSPRVARYQISRFCEWQGFKDGFYRYRITPASLRSALTAGLQIHHLIALIRRYAESLPPNLHKALDRWAMYGDEARIEKVTVLRVREPSLLDSLRKSRASRYLGDILGPTTVIISPGSIKQITSALAELGLLSSVEIEEKN
jgi:hypothetical protein